MFSWTTQGFDARVSSALKGISSEVYVKIPPEVQLKVLMVVSSKVSPEIPSEALGFPPEATQVVSPEVMLGVNPEAPQNFPGVPSKANQEIPVGVSTERFLLCDFQ